MNPVLISSSRDIKKLSDLLNNLTITLLLIFGTDPAAKKGQEFCRHQLEYYPEQYPSVRFLFVANANLVLPILESLQIRERNSAAVPFKWSAEIACLSISPSNNLISYLIAGNDLLNKPGLITIALTKAFINE